MQKPMTIRSKTVLIFTCFLLTAILAACATARETKPSDKTTSTVSAQPATLDTNISTEQWDKSRAAYERDLDYATIEQNGEYKSKRALVEAKYYFDLALMDLTYNRDKSIAVNDLDKASSWLKSSLTSADQGDRADIQALLTAIQSMRKSAQIDAESSIAWLPEAQQASFDDAKATMERIIQK